MKIKYFFALMTIGSMLFHTDLSAQYVMHTPAEYVFPVDDESKPIIGQPGQDFWMVFSDRSNNLMYANESCSIKMDEKVSFMQTFLVIMESKDHSALKVVDYRWVTDKGQLIDSYQSHSGWMTKSRLLLSPRCLKTRNTRIPGFENGIFNKKALVLNSFSDPVNTDYEPPKYYSDPGFSEVIDTALSFEINYIFKETADAYLLASELMINPEDLIQVKGWVKKGKAISWNNNLAFEANWDRPAVQERNSLGIRAKIFEKPEDAEKYYTGQQTTGFGFIPFDENDGSTLRPIGDVDRFPILDYSESGRWKVGVIGSLIGPVEEKIPRESFDFIKHNIDSICANIRNVNIVFVMDASTELLPYKDFIISALINSINSLNSTEDKKVKFGVALYRDAAEEAKAFQAYPELVGVEQIPRLTNWINNNMIEDYNKCDEDLPQSMYYGIKKAVTQYALSPGQSNFVILIGGCGNHDRKTYLGPDATGRCAKLQKEDFTSVLPEDIASLMARCDVNMISYQVIHGKDPSYNDFVTQVKDLYIRTATDRFSNPVRTDQLWEVEPSCFVLDTTLGGSYSLICPVNTKKDAAENPMTGTLEKNYFENKVSTTLKYIDHFVERQISSLLELVKGKDQEITHFSLIAQIIKELRKMGLTDKQIDMIFNNNSHLFITGYTMQMTPLLHYPLFLNVLLFSHEELYSLKYALEELIPTNEYCRSPDEFRSYIQEIWYSILIEQLHYLPPDPEMINEMTLYQLSYLLTGYAGREEYKMIKLKDVTDTTIFYEDDFYLYLIDWMITKGHIQSIFEKKNMFTGDFFRDHVGCYFIDYLVAYLKGTTGDPSPVLNDANLEQEIVDRLTKEFLAFNNVYKNIPQFVTPMGGDENETLNYYWIDSRIFPHHELYNRQMDIYRDVLNEFKERYQ